MTKSKVYFPNLNGIRFIAALSVMIYHFYGFNVLNGHLGVILFFVLSGFLITFLLFEEQESTGYVSLKNFYFRRVLRIWPLFFFVIILSFLINFYGWRHECEITKYYNYLPYYIFFLPNLAFVMRMDLPFISILWSIGSEEQFYLLWPMLIKFFRKNFLLIISLIFILFTFTPHIIDYVNHNYYSNHNIILYYCSNMLLRMSFSSMATGALLAYLIRFYPKYLNFIFLRSVQVICVILTLFFWIHNVEFKFNDQTYAILFGIIIVNASFNPKNIIKLENRVFNFLGKISYGLYVYHQITFSFTFFLIGYLGLNNIIVGFPAFISCVLITIAIAAISYNYFEKFFLNLKNRKFTIVSSGNKI